MKTELFDFGFSAGSALDIGLARSSNQDRVICRPELGFFAVSDGMGGLAQGGETSEIISEVLPGIVEGIAHEMRGGKADAERYGTVLASRVRLVSDNIYDTVNTVSIEFGATLSCVWLIGKAAIFVNLGDSRGYMLPRYRRYLKQITEDHNVAGELVRLGELTKAEAREHPSSSRLTGFVGMPTPALPDIFIEPVAPGDRLLLCSDGLHGMLYDDEIRRVMRSGVGPDAIGKRLVLAANERGGRDNISAVYIKIEKERSVK